jgi:unsaturated rhamnogalacturonyl hydrolase
MGRSFLARFYPRSAWVDSLMMVGVLQARHAAERAEREGLDRAARQPRLFAELLMDPGRGLWYHAYWTGLRSHYPRRPIFWARGNGWALYSIVAILELLPPGHPERAGLVGLLGRSSAALLPLQREDGFWDSLLEKPGRCYPEASATALIAAAWIRAAAAGWLSPEYGTAGARAFRALVASLQTRRGGLSLPGVSGPTIPLPLFPRAGYRLVPRFRDLPYGLAALGFAAIAWMRAGGAVDGKAGPGDTGSHDPA